MTTERFTDYVLSEYENVTGRKLSDSERAADRDSLVSGISETDRKADVTRKFAAVILHRAMQRLSSEEDEDWGIAKGFRDIYDCRVCANAIAQVAVKGIIAPARNELFGAMDTLPEAEAIGAVKRLWIPSLRITKLLESYE